MVEWHETMTLQDKDVQILIIQSDMEYYQTQISYAKLEKTCIYFPQTN